jgi:hypothetical protein
MPKDTVTRLDPVKDDPRKADPNVTITDTVVVVGVVIKVALDAVDEIKVGAVLSGLNVLAKMIHLTTRAENR